MRSSLCLISVLSISLNLWFTGGYTWTASAQDGSPPAVAAENSRAPVSRSDYADYRRVASLHGLTNDQLEKINQSFDNALAEKQSGVPVSRAKEKFFADLRKLLSKEQLKELDTFVDPQAGAANLNVLHDLPYVSPADPVRTGDLYLPKVRKNKDDRIPAVVFIHGGGWSQGSKEQSAHTAIELAKHGFAVFNINYRLVGKGGEFPADISDVKDAFAFFASKAEQWNLDPAKIAVMGGSAGAHLAMMLAYTSNKQFPAEHFPLSQARPIAVVSWFGPVDLQAEHPLIRQYLANAGAKAAKEASPIRYADTALPTLFVHGTADWLVDFSNSKRMYDALRQRKIYAELEPIEGAQHGFRAGDWQTAIAATLAFLDREFGLTH